MAAESLKTTGTREGEMTKENVQDLVWLVEAATFITTVIIVAVVWRVSRRDIERKKRQQQLRQSAE
jgi:uncharacterized membrane-anchored protein YhcB (DUF1043 family)